MVRKEVLTDTHELVEESSNTLGLVLIKVKKNNESIRSLKDAQLTTTPSPTSIPFPTTPARIKKESTEDDDYSIVE